MFVKSLKINNLRNIQAAEIRAHPKLNLMIGDNGAGKTNLLEAVHYLAMTRGFSGKKDQYTLQEGAQYFFTKGELLQETQTTSIQCNFVQGKGKKVLGWNE